MQKNEQFIDSYRFHPSMSIPFQASKLVLKCSRYTTHSKFACLIYSTDIINQTRATVRWRSGTSITGRGNMLADGGVMEASTPLLCIRCGQASVILVHN